MSRPAVTVSLLLVVHAEQAYLDEFTRSVLGQEFEPIEIVVVDDAATGHAPALLDALAQRDPRVRVDHLTKRAGLARARERALRAATGEYVWFVEATDLLARGSLEAIAERLRRTAPDVLLVHHEIAGPVGPVRPGPHRRMLARLAENGPVALDDRPALGAVAPGIWSKVFRREFLTGLPLAFEADRRGELGVTWPALLAARSIDASPTVGYVRRERPNAPSGDRPAAPDVLAGYEALLQRLPAGRRGLVAAGLRRDAPALLAGVPEPERRDAFGRLSRILREHDARGAPAARGRAARLQAQALARDSYAGFRAVEALLHARRGLARRRSALSRRVNRRRADRRRRRLARYYRSRLRAPIDPDLAVFAAYWYRSYACNPRAIYECAREIVPGFRGVWVVKRDAVDALPAGVEHVVAGTREYYDVIARAKWLVNNVNFPNHLVKREGTVHVMTHHGTPLKLMGLDERLSPLTKMDFAALMRRCARWDFSVSSNPHSTLVWERVYPLRYETLEVGYPRNDVLVRATPDDVARIRRGLGIRPDQTVILYAPTHREHQTTFVPVADLAALARGLGPEYLLLARAHYFYGSEPSLRRLQEEGRVRDVGGHPAVEELCLAADVLVTDYSSIMFDYAVLDRPIVVHAPDWELYQALRGTYFDIRDDAPGAFTRTDAELLDAFRSGAVWSEDAAAARARFRARFCALEDGKAAERVVRRVWFGEAQAVPAGRGLAVSGGVSPA